MCVCEEGKKIDETLDFVLEERFHSDRRQLSLPRSVLTQWFHCFALRSLAARRGGALVATAVGGREPLEEVHEKLLAFLRARKRGRRRRRRRVNSSIRLDPFQGTHYTQRKESISIHRGRTLCLGECANKVSREWRGFLWARNQSRKARSSKGGTPPSLPWGQVFKSSPGNIRVCFFEKHDDIRNIRRRRRRESQSLYRLDAVTKKQVTLKENSDMWWAKSR